MYIVFHSEKSDCLKTAYVCMQRNKQGWRKYIGRTYVSFSWC